MKIHTNFIEAALIYIEVERINLDTLQLQQRVCICNKELKTLIGCHSPSEITRFRNLQDEIFGCNIEVQSLRLHAKRLLKRAQGVRLGNTLSAEKQVRECAYR